MKSYQLHTIFAAAALAAGCNDYDETNSPAAAGKTTFVKLRAEVSGEAGTRANIQVGENTFTGQWEDDDAMGVLFSEPGTSVLSELRKFTYNSSEFGFEGELPQKSGDWQYLAFYPHAPVSGTRVSIPFGNLRTQRGNAFNCATDALAAEPLAFTGAEPGLDDLGEPIRFRLQRLTSILNLRVTGGGDPADKVRYVLLTSRDGAAQPLSTRSLDFDISQPGSPAALNAADRSEAVALGFEPGTAPSAQDLTAFFNVPPGNYTELTFDVITESKQIGTVSVARSDRPFEAGKLYRKEVADMTFSALALPSLDWPGEDMDAVHPITINGEGALDYSAAIDIHVPGGIAGLVVDIDSPALIELGLTRLDLFNETELPGLGIAYGDLLLSSGTEVQYKKSCVFDITGLVPLISILPGAYPGSLHTFKVTVTDLAGQATRQSLAFRIPGGPAVTYNQDADLWANTASLSIHGVDAAARSVVLQYRAEGETAWNTATVSRTDDGYTASIGPSWSEETNAAELTVHIVDPKTGVFARKTYQYQLLIDGQNVQSGKFTPSDNGGDEITGFESGSSCFNTSNTEALFWGSGNNTFAKSLCTFDSATSGAVMTATKPIMLVNLAPGNLFTGTFKFNGVLKGTGTVAFGQKYIYSARPTALKLTYKATIGNVTATDSGSFIAKGEPDQASIVVCIVDWNTRHETTAGKGKPTGVWSAETLEGLASDKKVIGYGVFYPDQTTAAMSELVIPIHYYDKEAAAPTGKYTIIISCATSRYGDYLNGCDSNRLQVADFQWVY